MKYRIFDNFREASKYAKSAAITNSRSVKIERRGNKFAVQDFDDLRSSTVDSIKTSIFAGIRRSIRRMENRDEELRRWHEGEGERRRIEEEARKAERREKYLQRKPYLIDRETIYREMDGTELERAWKRRDLNQLEKDEKALLRDILRERKGITPTFAPSVRVCGSCGQVGENCTCKRSWY